MTESTFFAIAFVLYILSALVYLAAVFVRKEKWAKAGLALAAAGLAVHTGALILRTAASGHAPFTNMYESVSFLAWASALAVVALDLKWRIHRAAPWVMLIVVALVAMASAPLWPKDVVPLMPALQSYWLWLHVSVTLLGEAFFAVAFVASILYLLAGREGGRQKRAEKGPLSGDGPTEGEDKKDRMDALAYRAVAVGFPLFTLGGLVFGMVWAYRAWGRYWAWDPKEVWSLITWFVFALYLHTRIVMGWKGKRSAWIAIAGFLAALFTYFGVNYLLSGLHSYV